MEYRDRNVMEPKFKFYLYNDNGELIQEHLTLHEIQHLLLLQTQRSGTNTITRFMPYLINPYTNNTKILIEQISKCAHSDVGHVLSNYGIKQDFFFIKYAASTFTLRPLLR